jgi:hypothetical protein
MRLAALFALPVLALPALAGAAETSFLFDVLRFPHYRLSWNKLLKDVQPEPDWLREFDRNYDGAAGEVTPITIEGKEFQLSYVCNPTDCAAYKFEVLFDAEGIHAYGALGGKNDTPAFFGAPTPAMQEALAKAVKG